MFHAVQFEGLVAIFLTLSIPIVAIVMRVSQSIKKNNNERKLREAIINNHTDAETAKLLIEQQTPRSNQYVALRWGCVLLGLGLGAAINALAGLDVKDDIYFWLILAAGCGLGFLASFFVEMKLQQKSPSDTPAPGTPSSDTPAPQP
jgi:hypothetical protein